jgi:hypothetical protein
MSSERTPETFNDDLTNEIAHRAFCKAANRAIKLIEEDATAPLVTLPDRLHALASIMSAAQEGFIQEEKSDYDVGDD